ncbi:MAG: sigma-70 family RNA polymerase sigma factor [Verrucomicrobiales bacterium]|nr:sigma-70 family RNA polymerase sigma factor [Verrucomicrobiales bacterium]
MDDWALLQAYAARGAEEAFRELLHRHADMVFATARRVLGGDPHLAQDVAQRTFCLLAQKAGRLPRTGALGGWLHWTSYNLARETLRTERRRTRREHQAATMPSPTTESADPCVWESLAPVLDEAIHSLPEADQAILIQRFLQRRSHRDVAAILGISEHAAKMRVQRSLGRLRKALTQRGVNVSIPVLGQTVWTHAWEPAATGLIPAVEQALRFPRPSPPSPPSTLHLAQLAMQLGHMKTRWGVIAGIALSVGWLTSHLIPTSEPTTSLPSISAIPSASTTHTPEVGQPRHFASVTRPSIHTSTDLAEAVARLRSALNDPWPSRRAPINRVLDALRDFGSQRREALPILMEALNRKDLGPSVLAAYGLIEIGHDAAEVLPEIVQMTTTGRLAILNELLPQLITAVAADLSPVAALVSAMAEPPIPGRGWIAEAILALVRDHPNAPEVPTIHAAMLEFLSANSRDIRREAAIALARWPGTKSPEPVAVLVEALAIDRLRAPDAYAPVYHPEDHTTLIREGERWEDEMWRTRAVKALRQLGPTAQNALAALDEVRALIAADTDLHRDVLRALGAIDPSRRSESAEIETAILEGVRTEYLASRLRTGQASMEELIEGLRFRETESESARALESFGDLAVSAVPALESALDRFGSFEAAQRLKRLAPERLVERVQQNRRQGLEEVVIALGELGPEASAALPHLERISAEIPASQHGTHHALAEAIAAIDPQHPKTLYTFDELSGATQSLVQEIYRSGKTQNPVYDLYLTGMQDLNAVSRARLLRFVDALRVDGDLHQLFVDQLIERNPELRADLKPSP